ncbi:MAG: UvrD-helicase domain-containing protein, partial [Candidatus Obscuribacterales bacterium]|nr:UvrD-helicase domain-containing protein [Candidatus Obscuribacterales bacterium]
MPPLTDEQVKAILSIDEHVLVSAGAGSGKTFVLVERYIKVLESDNDASVADIIAVTYTRKAAEEMRTRLKARLKEIAASAEGDAAKRWTKCLSEVESARIGTIHSLCESLLKNYPSEAGIDPGFEILDDLERAEILAESIDESLHYIIERTEDEFSELLEFPIEDLRKWIASFMRSALKYKDSRNRLGDCSQQALTKFAEAFIEQDIARALEEYVSDKKLNFEFNYQKDSLWKDPSSKIGLIQTELLSYLEQIFDKDGKSKAERWDALCALAKMESARTSGGPAAKELRDSMKVLRGEAQLLAKSHSSVINQADQLSFTLLRALISVTDSALAKYEALKQQHQKLDFDDLIERCQHLLTNNKHALKQISKNLRAVLIDEFQDTNWTQAKLLIALAGEKAKLFLIGDDKQSIYKFQGADVGTFNACKIYIRSLLDTDKSKHRSCAEQYTLPVLSGTGQLMTLSQSFRSHPEIVNFVNHLFRTLFDATQESEDYKSRFQALRPARTGVNDEDVRVDVIYTPEIDPETPERSFEIEKIESQLTAQWIKEKVESGTEIFDKSLNTNRKINYSDFAILLQANSDFAGIEK